MANKTIRRILLVLTAGHALAALGMTQQLRITNVDRRSNSLELQFAVRNNTDRDVMIISPNLQTGRQTEYFVFPDVGNKILLIRRYLFSYPPNVLDVDEPCYSFSVVKAGSEYREKLSLAYPRAPSNYFTNATVDLDKYESVVVQTGVLASDVHIADISKSRPFGKCIRSSDVVSKGVYRKESLAEIQTILMSNPVAVPK
jgi:hypothetical protein